MVHYQIVHNVPANEAVFACPECGFELQRPNMRCPECGLNICWGLEIAPGVCGCWKCEEQRQKEGERG